MSCIIKACRSSRWMGDHTITFHRVPKDPLRRAQWADNCKIPIEDLKPLSFVCSDHFEEDCFKIRDGRNKILTNEAAPTVFNCNLFTNDQNSDSLDSLDYLEKEPQIIREVVTHQPLEASKDIVMRENITDLEADNKRSNKLDPTVECRLCLSSVLRENCVDVYRPFIVQFIQRLTLIEIEPLENTTDKLCLTCEKRILQAQKLAELIIRTDEILRQRLHVSPVIVCDGHRTSKPSVLPEEIYCEPFKQELEDGQLMQPIETCLVAIKKEELSSDEGTLDQDEVDLSTYHIPAKHRLKSSADPKPQSSSLHTNERKAKPLPAYKSGTYKYIPKPKIINFSKFECGLCGHVMTKKRLITLHMKRKHMKNRFKCQLCRQICNSEFAMRNHKLQLHFNEKKLEPKKKPVPRVKPEPRNRRITFGKFRCHFCDHESYQFAGIKQHILKHHLPGDDTVKCKECQQVFNHPDILKMHVRNLHNKKKELCNLCGKLLSDIFSLRQHIAYFHDKIKYRCKLCPLSVNHMSSLRKHMRKVHAIDTKIRCDICQTVFKTLSLLKMHIYSCHLIIASLNRVTCDNCKSEFDNDMKLELHMKAAHPSVTRKRQACVACNVNFEKVWQLTEHLQQHVGVFVCPGKECEKVFPSHNALACHHYHAHKTREINCNSCDYVTKSVAELVRHFETHGEQMVSNPG